MIKGHFYFLEDEYCEKFNAYGVMVNKYEDVNDIGKVGGRPCFYALPDELDDTIFWMVPISSKIEKYEAIYERAMEKYGRCDGITFGYVRGRRAALLTQNICPVTLKYINGEYIDCISNLPVSIPEDVEKEVNTKARKIIRYAKQGKQISLTKIMDILKILKEEATK